MNKRISNIIFVIVFLTLLFSCVFAINIKLTLPSSDQGDISFLFQSDIKSLIDGLKEGTHNPYREFNSYINNFFYINSGLICISEYIFSNFSTENAYFMTTYIRDFVLGSFIYWATASIWHLVIYHIYVDKLFIKKGKKLPTSEIIKDQMKIAQASLFIYAALPVLAEYLIENNMTQVYFYFDQVGGWKNYLLTTVVYLFFVEIGIYWMHRTLHTNKFLYKWVHSIHHKYNKPEEMTPWASIAFSPIDGILQASPYVVLLFFLPVHYFTHVFLVFFSAIWATCIHDSMV
jgi:lathosterol oxidase